MPAEVAHEQREFRVAALLDQARDGTLVAEIVDQALAPCRAALERQRGVELVRAVVDPVAQPLAAGLGEGGLLQRAVFQDHHVPAEIGEDRLELVPEALANDRVERLPVIVDDPPAVAQPVLPAFDQRFVDIALVHLGIADERDHAALRTVLHPAAGAHIVLHQRGKERLGDAEADRAGGEVDIVDVLGARGIALRTLERSELLQLRPGLIARQILDGVEDRRGMRLDRYAILGPQGREIERRHDRRERCG